MDRIGLRFLRIDAQFTSVTSIVNHTRGNNLRRGMRHGDNEASGMNNARRNYVYCQQSWLVTEFVESTDRSSIYITFDPIAFHARRLDAHIHIYIYKIYTRVCLIVIRIRCFIHQICRFPLRRMHVDIFLLCVFFYST